MNMDEIWSIYELWEFVLHVVDPNVKDTDKLMHPMFKDVLYFLLQSKSKQQKLKREKLKPCLVGTRRADTISTSLQDQLELLHNKLQLKTSKSVSFLPNLPNSEASEEGSFLYEPPPLCELDPFQSVTSLPNLPKFEASDGGSLLYESSPLFELEPSQSIPSLPEVMRDQPNLFQSESFDTNSSLFEPPPLCEPEPVEGDTLQQRITKSIRSITQYHWVCSHYDALGCEPAVEVLSVTLRNENVSAMQLNSRNELCELYGEIYVHSDKGVSADAYRCFIFQHEQDDPEIIPFGGGTLTLTVPNDVMSMAKPIICMNIWDKTTGEAIIKGSSPLVNESDTITQDSFEQFHTLTVGGIGTGWFADVEYLELMFAVYARVEVKLVSNGRKSEKEEEEEEEGEGEGEGKTLDIYGTVTAEYWHFGSEKKVNRITLFEINKDSDNYERVTLGCPINLSRSVLVCHAYSTVKVSVDFFNRTTNELIVGGSYVFESFDKSEWMDFPGESYDAHLNFGWQKPYGLSEDRDDPNSICLPPELPTRLRETSHRSEARSVAEEAHTAVEVFSIFIGYVRKDEQLSLHGMVNFCRGKRKYNLFERDKNNPYILPNGCGLLPLEHRSPPLEPGDHFFLSVDLEDSEKKLVIKGVAHSYCGINLWFDRPLSYFIKGADYNGFAVVNYTVFSCAFVVSLRVHLSIEGEVSPGTCTGIYGSLIACYSDFGCKTRHEKSFQTILFERNAENPLKAPSTEIDLKLSRRWIPVSVDNTLLIKVDLHSISNDGHLADEWKINLGNEDFSYQGDQCKISVNFNWRILTDDD